MTSDVVTMRAGRYRPTPAIRTESGERTILVYHADVTTNHALRVQRLIRRYGTRNVVDGISFDIGRGECVGILGPNGAGKTTTLEIIQGLTEASGGTVEVLGLSQPRDRRAIQARIGVALQDTRLHEKLTTRETLVLFRSFYRSGPHPETLLEQVDLENAADTLVGSLSGGQRQRLALACALTGNPELVILDEPTTGLDPEARHRVWELVSNLGREGRSVLLTTHFMDEAERLCSRILIVDRGQIIAHGTPTELVNDHLGTHVIELEQGSRSDEFDIHELSELEGVRIAFVHGRTLRIGTSVPDSVLQASRHHMHSRQIELARVLVRHATLEDVFLVLTGRSLEHED
jgi:ABC-2 type transport system ATP-binding protein